MWLPRMERSHTCTAIERDLLSAWLRMYVRLKLVCLSHVNQLVVRWVVPNLGQSVFSWGHGQTKPATDM